MYVIKNATVYTMSDDGVVKADILVENGKIAAIGENLSAETVIDAAGKVITPGFVDAHSHIGGIADLTPLGEDLNEITNPLTPELDAYYGINPGDKCFGYAIEQGITTSCLAPGSANVVCGWSIAFKSAGTQRLVKDPVALKAAMGINPKGCYAAKKMAPMTRMAIANIMKKYLRDVKDYMAKKEAAGDDAAKLPPYDLGLEHGIPVIEKKIPLKVHSYMHDMMTLLEIAKEFDILITVDHAQGASDFADELADPHVKGVIFGPTCEPLFPGEGGKLDYECCRMLDDRGVNVAVMTDGPVTTINMLLYEIGEAVRKGMDPVRALGMVTVNAAKILGIEDRVGSLAVGMDADILIWSDLPSQAADAVLERVIVDGETVFEVT
ncbi:MAG: amidohydrolase family protein [Faecousia sp.]